MIHPLKVLISEYTVMSILMTMIMPGTLVANETTSLEDGSNIVFSQSGMTDTPTTDILTGNVINNSGDTIVFETGIINIPPVMIDNGGSGVIDTMNSSGDVISSGSTDILSGSIQEVGIIEDVQPTETHLPTNTGSVVQEIVVPVVQPIDEKIYEKPVEKHPEGEILIQFKGSIENVVGEYQIDQIESLHNLKTTETIVENNIAVMESTIPAVMNTILNENPTPYEKTQKEEVIENIISELKNDPRVAHVQRNFVYTTQSSNDPEYTKLWGLNNEGQNVNENSGIIDADIDYPEAITYISGELGTSIIVAVLDTGVAYDHPDLKDHMWNGTSCLSDTGASLGGCIHGYDFVYNDTNPSDVYGHGTHVSGTIGAISNNSIGVVGVSPNVTIMSVKVLDDNGGGSTVSIIRGINFAKHNGARIINASFGGTDMIKTRNDFDFLTYEAIRDFPGLFIAAAGNSGTDYAYDPNTKNYPSGFGSDTVVSGEVELNREIVLSGSETIPALYNVISVAASDQHDNLTYFSNYGTGTVHIAAPGENIYSTTINKQVISGEISNISYSNGWTRESTASGNIWNTRGNEVTNNSEVDLSGALWGDVNSPYISGENHFIEKSFSGITGEVTNMKLGVWCDTPSSRWYTDYLEVLVSTGGLYQSIGKIDEDVIGWYDGFPLVVDGHLGLYARFPIYFSTLQSNGIIDFRLRWHSDAVDDLENGIPHYGCAVKDLSVDTITETYGYGYKNGTSMATPHVAGAAALAWSYKADATIQEIRDAILWGGDTKESLRDRMMGGKRLNLLGMLQGLETPTIIHQSVIVSGESTALFHVITNIKDHSPEIMVSNNINFENSGEGALYAQALAQSGIINPESSESGYRLNDTITRAELARLTAKLGGFTPVLCTGTIFSDINSTLGDTCNYIEALAQAGIISTTNANFRPNANITRAEAVKLLLSALGETGSAIDAGYIDIANLGNLTQYINRANELGAIESEDYFRPNASAIRGEVFQIAAKLAGLSIHSSISGNFTSMAPVISASGTSYGLMIDNLQVDTFYYYKTRLCTPVQCNSDQDSIHTFRTPKSITQNLNTPILVSGEIYLSGSTQSGMIFSGSTQSGMIIFENTGSVIRVILPTRGLQIITSGSWDGILKVPQLINTGSITLSGNTTESVQRVWSVGSDMASLTLSGQVATLSIQIIAPSGTILNVYRSPRTDVPYIKIGTCTITNNTCTFTTDHFSLFAIGTIPPVVVPTSPSPPIGSSNTAGPGGGGGGGGSVATTPMNTLMPALSISPKALVNIPSRTTSKAIIRTPRTLLLTERTLDTDIRTLQRKLMTLSINRRDTIITLQGLYRDKIRLLQSGISN